VHAHLAWSQKFCKSEVSLDSGLAGYTTGRASGLHIKVGQRAAHKAGMRNRAGRRAAIFCSPPRPFPQPAVLHFCAARPPSFLSSVQSASRGGRSNFLGLWLRSCSKIFESRSGNFQIWESYSCSDSGYNHRSYLNFLMFLLKKWPHRLLLLPRLKIDSGSGSGFCQIFDSGSERKTQNPVEVDCGTPDPVPPLPASPPKIHFFYSETWPSCPRKIPVFHSETRPSSSPGRRRRTSN